MMKKYTEAEIKVISFEAQDVITTSGGEGGDPDEGPLA